MGGKWTSKIWITANCRAPRFDALKLVIDWAELQTAVEALETRLPNSTSWMWNFHSLAGSPRLARSRWRPRRQVPDMRTMGLGHGAWTARLRSTTMRRPCGLTDCPARRGCAPLWEVNVYEFPHGAAKSTAVWLSVTLTLRQGPCTSRKMNRWGSPMPAADPELPPPSRQPHR
jgi:hypothetical protein